MPTPEPASRNWAGPGVGAPGGVGVSGIDGDMATGLVIVPGVGGGSGPGGGGGGGPGGGGGGEKDWTSTAPMSTTPPTTRGNPGPRWSTAPTTRALLPVLMAGLPT